MRSLPKEIKYPGNYNFENVRNYINSIGNDNCVTLLAPAGFGKSNLIRFICFNQNYQKLHQLQPNINFINFDLSILSSFTREEFIKLLNKALIDEISETGNLPKEIINEDKNDLSNGLEIQLSNLSKLLQEQEDGIHYHIILDNFDYITHEENKELLNFIRYIRDNFGYYIQFTFVISNLNLFTKIQNISEKLSEIVNQKKLFLKLDTNPNTFFVNTGPKISKKQLNKILIETGGIPSYVKQVVINNNNQNLNIHKKILKSLTKYQNLYLSNLAQGKVITIPKTELNDLFNLGLIRTDKNNENILTSRMLEEDLKNNVEINKDYNEIINPNNKVDKSEDFLDFMKLLTKKEYKLMKMLFENSGKIVERDDVIDLLWEHSNINKYSNWALDQIVLRLRNKLKEHEMSYKIKTKRGRGYILEKKSIF